MMAVHTSNLEPLPHHIILIAVSQQLYVFDELAEREIVDSTRYVYVAEVVAEESAGMGVLDTQGSN